MSLRELTFKSHGHSESRFRPTGNISAVHFRSQGSGTSSFMFGSVGDALALPVPVASAIAPAPPPAWIIEDGVAKRPRRIAAISWRKIGKAAFHVTWTLVAAVLAEGLHLWDHMLSLIGR